ncbi:MAG: hypothetical protein KA436_10980 [Oligoflexales bacterium]|nr:hypothetical protein [Oligoflexales bacterium]
MSTIYIITGTPGSGKSTASDQLALGFERGIHIQGDSIYNMVHGGYKYPWEDKDEFLTQTMLDAMVQVHRVYSARGFVSIIDYVFSIDQLCYFISQMEGDISLTALLPDCSINVERDKHRTWTIGEERVIFYHRYFETVKEQLAVYALDNSQMSVDDTCSSILGRKAIPAKDLLLSLKKGQELGVDLRALAAIRQKGDLPTVSWTLS